MDPVCLLTCYPQLLYNFIYKSPTLAALRSPAAALDAARFVCSRDLTIAQTICRRFHWAELMLWPDDLPRRERGALVVLSGQDDLVPARLVQAQFAADGHPAEVMYHPRLGHGGTLLDAAWMEVVVARVAAIVGGQAQPGGGAPSKGTS
jgi:hypothetical protein